MCDIAIASIATTALSTAVGMFTQYEQQSAQEKAATQAAEHNAQMAANEQAQQLQLARNEIAKGEADKSRQQRMAARQMGEMRSGLAASGFEMDSGSHLSLLGESAEEAQHDSNIISQNANMAAWQHQVGAVNASNNQAWANYQKSQAGSGRTASLLGMGGTLLGGIATGLGQYNKFSETKTTGESDLNYTTGGYLPGSGIDVTTGKFRKGSGIKIQG